LHCILVGFTGVIPLVVAIPIAYGGITGVIPCGEAKTFQEATLRVVSIFVFRCLLGITGVIPCGEAKTIRVAFASLGNCLFFISNSNKFGSYSK